MATSRIWSCASNPIELPTPSPLDWVKKENAATDALIRSRNIPAVAVAAKLGKPNLYDLMRLAGVRKLQSEAHYGLALVLIYIGGKMLAMPWFHMPVQWSLAIVGSIVLASVLLSMHLSHRKTRSAL